MKRFLKRNWAYLAAIAAGAAIMPAAIKYAAEFRGYEGGIGGEFFIVPLFVMLVSVFKNAVATAREFLGGKEEADGEEADFGAHREVKGRESCR